MQEITREDLIKKAKELLGAHTVSRVLGFKKGEFDWDATPAVFRNDNEFDQFVYNGFCGANFSKYLVSETNKEDGKVLVFLKPCDCFSFNQLLTEHRFDREKVYAVGIPCNGILDIQKIRRISEDVASVESNGEGKVIIQSLYDGQIVKNREELFLERCINCRTKKHVAYDELLGEEGADLSSNRFDEVERLEKMTPDERFAFWQKELSRCIRCNACRDVCPACTCEKCVFDNPDSGVENKAAANEFEEKMFHIIRAFHVAGRCTDCGECSRVCPQHIPLHLLNRKFIKDINGFYGDYQAGEEVGSRAPVVNFSLSDREPSEAVKEGNDA